MSSRNATSKPMAVVTRTVSVSRAPARRQPQQQQQRGRPAPRRRNRRRQRLRNGLVSSRSVLSDPFIRCVLSIPSQIATGATVPDGDATPMFIFEHRQTILVLPDASGRIGFALISSPGGGIGMGYGIWQSITTNTIGAGSAVTGINNANISSTNPTVLAGNYPLIPYKEWLQGIGEYSEQNRGTLKPQQFKIVGCSARVMYTGDDFHNSGVAVTGRLNMQTSGDAPIDTAGGVVYAGEIGILAQLAPFTFTEVSALAGARTFPITESVDLNNVPTQTAYRDTKLAWIPATPFVGAFPTSGAWLGVQCRFFAPLMNDGIYASGCPGLGYGQTSFYAAQGLQAGQSLCIEVKTCVQYVPAVLSPMANMAKMPDAARPNAITALQRISRVMPSSKPASSSWVTGASDLISVAGPLIGNALAGPIGGLAGTIASRGLEYAMDSMSLRPRRNLALNL